MSNQTERPHDCNDVITSVMASLLPLHTAITIDWLVDAACTAAERALNAPYALVYWQGQDGSLKRHLPASDLRRRQVRRALDAFGEEAFPSPLDPERFPLIAQALDARAPAIASAGELLGRRADAKQLAMAQKSLGVDSVVIVPLESAGERLGALVLLCAGKTQADHARLLGEHVACAASNLRETSSEREANVDILRAIFDARKFESELQRELYRAARYKREISIVLIEATNMRLLREQFGTFLTDRLLQRVGEALAQTARDSDLFGVYKSSGYAVMLTETSADAAAAGALRLLTSARAARIEGDNVPGLEVHLAAGWASFPGDGTTSDMLIAAAEARMYSSQGQAEVA